MSDAGRTVERLPVSAELRAELAIVASRGWRRVMRPVVVALPILWIGVMSELHGDTLQRGLVATLLTGLCAAVVLVFAHRWTGRIRNARYVIRERGELKTRGLEARLSGDRTKRSIASAIGPVRLDNDIDEDSLDRAWTRLIEAQRSREPLEIDYTADGYLLAVRDAWGREVFSRGGYVRATGTAETVTAAELPGTSSITSGARKMLLGLLLIIGCIVAFVIAIAVDIVGTEVFALLLIAALAGGLFFVVIGAFAIFKSFVFGLGRAGRIGR